jgi:hypothetical protein
VAGQIGNFSGRFGFHRFVVCHLESKGESAMFSIQSKFLCSILLVLLASPMGFAEEVSNQELMKELKAMKARIQELEARLAEAEGKLSTAAATGRDTTDVRAGGVQGLERRIQRIEEAVTRDVEGENWWDRLQIGGLVEVEAGHESVDSGNETESTGDVDLATVELYFDAKLHKHVDGHVLLKYEEDEVFVDEGFVTLVGSEQYPAFLIVGRQYVPFGNFDSVFVTDPNTLLLAETNEGAATAGYRFAGETVGLAASIFNGKAKKTDSDDTINGFTARIRYQPMEDLNLGASYTSNLSAADTFNGFLVDPEGLGSLVGGWSLFATYRFLDRFTLIGEYAAAIESFNAGELYRADDPIERRPTSWNLEMAYAVLEHLEIGLRYGGSDDGGAEFLPETQYGAVVNWGIYGCNLAFEYLRDDFEDDVRKIDTFTTQLAVEF